MIKYLSKILGALVISLLLMVGYTHASGKLEVDINEEVRLTADSRLESASYQWVVVYENEILNTQTTRNFLYKFPYQG
ncbi:hypothetical protein IPJ72_02295 [Candidatus Peregrinibacteria bacterium]|nr:MAG: hypothetical protein IPJ72_02295 [Candidatus Peregrinibacteria bacterium]